MSSVTLYWHDYETFGADPRRDRPAQFAGLRTDTDFNPVGEALVLYCQPARDVLPVPEARLITGITPQQALARGMPEAHFIARIHGELIRPGTCALGYNTLRFDDEVTRHTLYRNFFDAYEREWRNGNSRWDIIDMVRATAALRPDGMVWPVDESGRPSFRLERLTAANGIGHEGAHDALADVRATIELARRIRRCQPRLYDFLWRHRDKHSARQLLQLGGFEPVLHVSEKFSAERHCLALVVALARHPTNSNGIIVFDLAADPEPLLELTADEIRRRLYTRADQLPAGSERIPLKTVHLNRAPVLAPLSVLRPADAERLALDLATCRSRASSLRQAQGLAAKLAEVFSTPPPEPLDGRDPDLMLYGGGFFSDADRHRIARIRELSPSQLRSLAVPFEDPRLPEMLFRYRARNFPESLDPEERERWEQQRRRRLTETGAGASIVLEQFQASIARLLADPELNPQGRTVLEELRSYALEVID